MLYISAVNMIFKCVVHNFRFNNFIDIYLLHVFHESFLRNEANLFSQKAFEMNCKNFNS